MRNPTEICIAALRLVVLVGALAAATANGAVAQDTLKPCTDGRYEGADGVRKRWVHDEYVWAVTRDFARRFCMPEAFIDEELQGAEAVAFRIKSGTRRMCEIRDGQETCSTPVAYRGALRFEVYLKREAKVPAARPDVEFAIRFDEHQHSGHMFSSNRQRSINLERERLGAAEPPPGYVSHWALPYTQHSADRNFGKSSWSWGVVAFKGDRVVSATGVLDALFLGNWSDGIDLLALDGTSGHLTQPGRDWQGARVAIVLQQTSPRPRTPSEDLSIGQKKVPDGFAYAVVLPPAISRAITSADQGLSPDWDAAIRATITNRK